MLKVKSYCFILLGLEYAVSPAGMGRSSLTSFSCQVNSGTLSLPAFCLSCFRIHKTPGFEVLRVTMLSHLCESFAALSKTKNNYEMLQFGIDISKEINHF